MNSVKLNKFIVSVYNLKLHHKMLVDKLTKKQLHNSIIGDFFNKHRSTSFFDMLSDDVEYLKLITKHPEMITYSVSLNNEINNDLNKFTTTLKTKGIRKCDILSYIFYSYVKNEIQA